MSHVKFPYHPNIYQLEFGPIERNQDDLVCQVCGCVPDLYLDSMYTTEEVDCLCLDCVASGAAADKFDCQQALHRIVSVAKKQHSLVAGVERVLHSIEDRKSVV